MTDDQITALAREYAEEGAEEVGLPNCPQNETLGLVTTETECVIKWLLRRFYLVEKSKAEELDIAFRVKHYGNVVLSRGDIESLFPEIAKQVEE